MNRLFSRVWNRALTEISQLKYKNIHQTARVDYSVSVSNSSNLVMGERTNIDKDSVILNTRAKFIMKKWSGAAVGLTVVTGNHMSVCGLNFKDVTDKVKDKLDKKHQMDKDVVVEEDVWLGARVTLLSGAHVGRGSIVGSNCVVRSGKTPPYAILVGNPAKVVGFRFSPEDIIEHEKVLYPKEERLPMELLEKNYDKYFLKHLDEIKQFTRL